MTTGVERRRIVVAGAADGFGDVGTTILRELRWLGFDAVAVNPDCDEVDGAPCYRHLSDVPGTVDAVVPAVSHDRAAEVVAAVAACGIARVWLVHGLRAVPHVEVRELCATYGVEVVEGLCPVLFLATDRTE